ncbi:MAG: response regulator transcription factor [Erysipelotrichales bacterium]|nr:response regulator transcription factor [Erysipelotrichales bacterium]
MVKILVAEDELHLRSAIAKTLKNEGYTIIECFDGKNALESFLNEHIDIIITDVMMPRLDGNQLVTEIRKINKDVPIIMLTALETIKDKEKGFFSGIDDYLVKPILMKELVLRIKAVLRRIKINSEKRIELGSTILEIETQKLMIADKEVVLNKKEFQLLFKLLSSPNIIFSRERLLNEVWGYDSESADRTVDTHISRLKKKVVTEDFEILTVWGLGYKVVLN